MGVMGIYSAMIGSSLHSKILRKLLTKAVDILVMTIM
jgi:hypothetical protein